MLENLDHVDWSSLEHAYGEASDVPDLLRSLLATDSEVREEAIYELFGNIWHQGTVYPASAAAVPFLYELLTAPDVRDKPNIAHLLASIADGVGYLEVHAAHERGEANWRKILAESGKTLERELGRERAEIDAVHRAASAGLRHLLPYLNDSEPEIRRAVAAALGNYPEHAAWALPALETALRTEADEEVREALSESQIRQANHRA
ncbi:MAG: HEAT repeat domain-containing protein [Candidatus Contendobacter sp.]